MYINLREQITSRIIDDRKSLGAHILHFRRVPKFLCVYNASGLQESQTSLLRTIKYVDCLDEIYKLANLYIHAMRQYNCFNKMFNFYFSQIIRKKSILFCVLALYGLRRIITGGPGSMCPRPPVPSL
jgi:hypothetical protein